MHYYLYCIFENGKNFNFSGWIVNGIYHGVNFDNYNCFICWSKTYILKYYV